MFHRMGAHGAKSWVLLATSKLLQEMYIFTLFSALPTLIMEGLFLTWHHLSLYLPSSASCKSESSTLKGLQNNKLASIIPQDYTVAGQRDL